MRGVSLSNSLRAASVALLGMGVSLPALAAEGLGGHHHSAIQHVEALPAAWSKQPIRYQDVPPDSDLAITLDQQLYPALLPLITRFAHAKNLKIAVQEGTCGISSGALLDKKVDMGGFCCPAAEGDRLPGLQFHTLGIGAIALVKNVANPLENISVEKAREVYQGKVSSWQQLGAEQQALPSLGGIKATARLHCKSRPGHWRLILDNEDMFSTTVTEVSTIEDMLARVAEERDALGYETLWMIERFGKGRVATLNVEGVAPQDGVALAAGRYPFYRTFNITSWREPTLARAEIGELVAYLKANFHTVAAEYGIVTAQQLRQAGWSFAGDELMAPPGLH